MRILPASPNYFSKVSMTNKENKNNPSFSRLYAEDSFEKEIKKSKDFTALEKNQVALLVALMKPSLNKPEFKDIITRVSLIKADPKDNDERAHKDRILLSVEGDKGMEDGFFIDPCIRYDDPKDALDSDSLNQLAKDLLEWHKQQAEIAKLRASDDSGPPEPYEDERNPFDNEWYSFL